MHLIIVSTYPPRRCGLATFAADLRAALHASLPHWRVDVCAVDRDGLSYGPEVTSVLAQDDPADYPRVARRLAAARPDAVVIQHEYGIFGGPEGAYVRGLTSELTALGVPYAMTLHTVLAAPSAAQQVVLADVIRPATLLTSFTDTARDLLVRGGVADPRQVAVVPHGVPAHLTVDPPSGQVGTALATVLAELDGARVLSTFGLLRPGKGLDAAIAAMPAVVARHPRVRYVIAGATHPEVLRTRGETDREELVALTHRLGVAPYVRFVNAFLTDPELAALLRRTEIYLTPYRNAVQTCSGALTFALAAGCPVVSTWYPYAVDLLTPPGGPERGLLVPLDDPAAFAAATMALLDDPPRLAATRAAAAELGATLTWPAVGARFAAELADRLPRRVDGPARLRPARLHELVDGAHRMAPPAPATGGPANSAEIGT